MQEIAPIASSIAIVDDHEDVRTALRSLLRSYGYEAVCFDSAESLLASPELPHFACIVTDLQMPGMSGVELLEQLRREGCLIPLVVLTAFPESAVRQRALQAGATCFLSKPCQSDDLMLCVQHACASSSGN